MTKLSEQTVTSLTAAGWNHGRRVDVSRFVAAYERVGHPIFPVVISFLEKFGDLQLNYPHFRNRELVDSCNFRADIAARIEPTWLREYEEHVGERLVPIGAASREHMDLLMTEKGTVYACYEDLACFVAADYAGVLNALCEGREFDCEELDDDKKTAVASSDAIDRVKERLIAAGWVSGRSVPVTTKAVTSECLEIEVPSKPERFLKEFCALRIRTEPGGEFDINPAVASSVLEDGHIREICLRLGIQSLTPIGMAQPGAIAVVMDDAGRMFGTMPGIPDWLVKYGDDPSSSVNAVVSGVGAVTI